MDLQAILDASDSSEDGVTSGGPSNRFPDASSHMDLELILRQEEETDDDDDDNAYAVSHNLQAPWESNFPNGTSKDSSLYVNGNSNNGYGKLDTTSEAYGAPSVHNAEDWSVLQSILHEDDEDADENDEEGWMGNGVHATQFSSPKPQERPNVDALLFSDDNNDEFGNESLSAALRTVSPPPPLLSLRQSTEYEARDDDLRILAVTNSSEALSSRERQSSKPSDKYGEASGVYSLTATEQQQQDEQAGEKISILAMSHAQAYERRLLKSGHREIVSPLMVKRRLKPKIELTSRTQNSRKEPHASERLTTVAASRFSFSGIVENKAMLDISSSLTKHSQTGAKVHCGLPTCLTFNNKFIAVGTQLGIILLYDLFEALRQRLGASGYEDNWNDKATGSVTTLDLCENGEMIIAGYTSGALILWDTIKGTVIRSVHESHPSPITAARFLSDLKIVTVDAGGLVNKLNFSKNIIWSNYSMETECLLDGTAGQILAMDVLKPFSTVNPPSRSEALAPVLGRLTLMALSSERSSFVVAVEPKINVLHRFSRPPPERSEAIEEFADLPSEQEYLPCLSWGWALVSGGGNVVMPILARAWGCCLQLLCASFPTLDDGAEGGVDNNVGTNEGEQAQMHWPAFGEHDEIDAVAPIVALEWLNDRSLVYLTVTNEFTLVDTVMMMLLERLDFSGLRLVYAEFALSRSQKVPENDTEPDSSSSCTTFLNSIRCNDDRLMVLCQEELKCISIVGARRRISSLEEDGEWLEALALALDHYESTVASQEDRKRDPDGRKDLSKHPEFSSAKSDDEEWIAKLLIRYLNLAVENAPENSTVPSAYSPDSAQTRIDLAQSHFQMLAGVCVEFCVVTRRLDLLFSPIFHQFQSVGQTSVFLDVLEPYVLNDKLAYIAPEVMSFFVDHCRATNGISIVERCLLHMDCTIMDFDTILSLLRKNGMHSALFYVFNQGLDDYVTPLEILLERVFDEVDAGSATLPRRKDGILQNAFESLGYKAIVYLQTCFKGKTFPHEKNIVPEDRQISLRPELMNFLLQKNFTPSPNVKNTGDRTSSRSLSYPYIRVMLQVDAKETLETLSLALDAQDSRVTQLTASGSNDDWDSGEGHQRMPSKQEALRVLSSIVIPEATDAVKAETGTMQLRSAFLDFAAKYAMAGAVRVDANIAFMIMTRMADRFVCARDAASRQIAQRNVMDLLSALPRDSYEPDKVLALIDKSGIHRAALVLHQQVASSWYEDGSEDLALRSRHFASAIDCYLGDDVPAFRKEVFAYVKKECSCGTDDSDLQRSESSPKKLQDSLFSKLPALVGLDALMTARLVAEVLVDELDHVVNTLESDDGGEALFSFLQPIVSGKLAELDPVAGSILNLTMEHHHKYLTIMAKLYPDMVYDYLAAHDNYRPEECLKLCQEHDIADASAYLLERMGNVSSALQLILQTLESRMMSLKRTIRGMGIETYRKHTKSHRGLSSALSSKQEKEVEGVKRILVVALDLCQRNSGTFTVRTEHGSQLWFNVLDRLINAKGFLRLSKEQPEHAKIMAGVLSDLLRLTMQRMVSSVPLTDLVRKVTSDHSGGRLGELREMVDSLLSTYGFELNVFQGAVTVFHNDLHHMQTERKDLQVHGSPVHSIMSIPLTRENPLPLPKYESSSLQIGGDGNATILESEYMPYSRRVESGFGATLSRLRSRRGVNSTVASKRPKRGRLSGLSMMTTTDQEYLDGESEPVVDGERPVGSLGEAQHRGNLRYSTYA